tara:strand:- start:297 stop:806 length:510 start_codon:yes stop_codon:yes gene_type:complete
MILGSRLLILLTIIYYFASILIADDKITSSPLLNIEKIKPSFENVEDTNENIISQNSTGLKLRDTKQQLNASHATLIGLDKITAKATQIIVKIDTIKKFGPLEIKILKCGRVLVNNNVEDVAYMQVKDNTKSENEKVFIFNGWTFSSDPSLTPFDHAIYDLQLVNCKGV